MWVYYVSISATFLCVLKEQMNSGCMYGSICAIGRMLLLSYFQQKIYL